MQPVTPSYKVIAFDCDGVMFDTAAANRAYYNTLLQRLDLPEMTDDQFSYAQAHTVDDTIAFLFGSNELIQQAYEELGYPSQQFHDRLMEAIAHLLATPEVKGPIRLVRPHVLYKYADPELEARSVGQKAMIRMGPENAVTIKAKLSELERALEARAQPLTEG